jgi:hypothetical protein
VRLAESGSPADAAFVSRLQELLGTEPRPGILPLAVTDLGEHELKGLGGGEQITMVMPAVLAERTFAPLSTVTSARRAREQRPASGDGDQHNQHGHAGGIVNIHMPPGWNGAAQPADDPSSSTSSATVVTLVALRICDPDRSLWALADPVAALDVLEETVVSAALDAGGYVPAMPGYDLHAPAPVLVAAFGDVRRAAVFAFHAAAAARSLQPESLIVGVGVSVGVPHVKERRGAARGKVCIRVAFQFISRFHFSHFAHARPPPPPPSPPGIRGARGRLLWRRAHRNPGTRRACQARGGPHQRRGLVLTLEE